MYRGNILVIINKKGEGIAMNYNAIHETILRDIVDVAKGFADSDEMQRARNHDNGQSFKSISSRSDALTLVFPVIASKNISYEAAAMIAKATERKATTMLHMLFSAINISDAKDGIDYLSRFHTNLKLSGVTSVDDFMDAMDDFVEENGLLESATDAEIDAYEKITRDLRNMNFYLEYEEVDRDNLASYFVVNEDGKERIVQEFKTGLLDGRSPMQSTMNGEKLGTNTNDSSEDRNGKGRRSKDSNKERTSKPKNDTAKGNSDKTDMSKSNGNSTSSNFYGSGDESRSVKDTSEIQKIKNTIERERLLDYDIKKANELVPTMMYVNFVTVSDDSKYPIASTMVIGIKAKLYAVDSEDIMNRIKIKRNDRNLTLNLVRATTREISFFRDFLFAIDRAKIDALSQSNRGSSNKIWKVLERRALKSKIKRRLFMTNDATAISTLVVSQEDVEYLRKTEYINVEDPRVIRPILDAYNLMGFVIVDESLEIAKFIYDTGEDIYEILTFDNLERESKDNSKKIINLMSKMNR